MDERSSPSIFFTLHFCPFLNIPDSSKRKNPECFYTRTIKAVYSFKNLLLTQRLDELKAKDMCEYLRDVVDDRSDTEKCWRAAHILQVPEQESEDETNTEPHEPSHKQYRARSHRCEQHQNLAPLGFDLSRGTRGLVLSRITHHVRLLLLILDRDFNTFLHVLFLHGFVLALSLLLNREVVVVILVLVQLFVALNDRFTEDAFFDVVHHLVLEKIQRDRLLAVCVLEAELSGGDKSTAHQYGKNRKTHCVVLLVIVSDRTRVVREHVRMVECHAHKEHGQAPTDRTEHPLTAIVFHIVPQVAKNYGVGKSNGRRCEELIDNDGEKNEKKRTLHVHLAVHDRAVRW